MLAAVVHLVFLDAHEHLDTGLGFGLRPRGHPDRLGREVITERQQPRLERLAPLGEEGDECRLVARLGFFGCRPDDHGREIELEHRVEPSLVHGVSELVAERDVREELANRPRPVRRGEVQLVLRQLVHDLQGVIANGAKGPGQLPKM